MHLSTLNKSKKKWRSAAIKIYCSRAIANVLNRKYSKISRASSGRVVINIAKDCSGFYKVDQVTLTELVKEKNISRVHDSNEKTPLRDRLNKLTSAIGKVGLVVAFLVLLVLLARYFTGHTKDANGNTEFEGSKTEFDDVMNAVVRVVAAAVTIEVVAIPEGLPLAVTLTLAYSMKRMMADQAMVSL